MGPPRFAAEHCAGATRPTRRHASRPSLLTALALLAFAPTAARAAPDYDPESTAWNGLSELVALAEREGVALEPVRTLDVTDLAPEDGLLVIYPTAALPTDGLLAFLRAGGRVALADDYGSGGALLHRFAIERASPPLDRASRLRGNPGLLLARPRGFHPLAEGVDALVTNHPVALVHAALEPVFAFDADGREALVLSGTVGAGKLVAIGDPSLFINRMMSLEGNRRFAAGLLRELASGGGRVFLARADAVLGGEAGRDPQGTAFDRIDDFLRSITRAELPAVGLAVATLVLCGIFAAFASGAVSLRGPYDAHTMLPPSRDEGGFSGWLRFYLDHPRNLLHPTLMYKHELEASLAAVLGLPDGASTHVLLEQLEARRLADARALVGALAEIEAEERRGGAAPRVSVKRFLELRRRGQAVLSSLGAGGERR